MTPELRAALAAHKPAIMAALGLVAALAERGIALEVRGATLYAGPSELVTAQDGAAIRAHKAILLELLAPSWAGEAPVDDAESLARACYRETEKLYGRGDIDQAQALGDRVDDAYADGNLDVLADLLTVLVQAVDGPATDADFIVAEAMGLRLVTPSAPTGAIWADEARLANIKQFLNFRRPLEAGEHERTKAGWLMMARQQMAAMGPGPLREEAEDILSATPATLPADYPHRPPPKEGHRPKAATYGKKRAG